jgi:antitoxin VapB
MAHTAKLFMNGRSQAVRLPAGCRFDGDSVYVRRDSKTGDVVLSARPQTWDAFFQLRDQTEIPDDFLSDRVDLPAQTRETL